MTVAGQAVQRSAYPDAYADDVPLAEALLNDPGIAGATSVSDAMWRTSSGTDCGTAAVAPGTVAFPLPRAAHAVDQANFGSSGGHWARGHTGTDFSAACGTPVLAATAGVVVIRTDQPWAGPWLVQVSTGVGRLTTWYAHMESLEVADGDRVEAGQPIGTVGTLGNSTGCHLHFEVHPRGGSIYEDGVNPTAWLAQNVGKDLGRGPETVPAVQVDSGEFILGTYNVLGHSHTGPGGNRPGWAPSSTRMKWAVQLLDKHAVDVVGLQEFQAIQKRALLGIAGDRYAIYSPPGDPQDSIAWRRSRFEFVEADTFEIPYFTGPRPMPIVRLRDRATGEQSIFVSVHNPADTRRFPRQAEHRRVAIERELDLMHRLSDGYGLPVFLTGDLNDRALAFCRLTSTGLLSSAFGGSNSGACRPPSYGGIDWIFATSGASFGSHAVIRGGKASDHPLVLAQVRR